MVCHPPDYAGAIGVSTRNRRDARNLVTSVGVTVHAEVSEAKECWVLKGTICVSAAGVLPITIGPYVPTRVPFSSSRIAATLLVEQTSGEGCSTGVP
jgi:hypothetical protein